METLFYSHLYTTAYNMRRQVSIIIVYNVIFSTNTVKRDIENHTTSHFRFLCYWCEYLQMSSLELKMS